MSDEPSIDPSAPFRGLHAVVTGGSGGMGRAVCRRLLGQGCQVIATGATHGEVEAAEADPSVSDATWRVLDVTDGESVRALFDAMRRLDVLVNFAGIGRGTAEYDEEGFVHTVDVNLFGTMRTCYAARSLLAQRGGTIVNTASMMSFFGSGSAPAYAASKGAVAQFTKSLAIVWANEGVRVNAVAPGWIETPMTTSMVEDRARSRQIVDRTPLGRWGTPEDVTEGVLFLASPSSSFVTGVILPVDGGYLVDGSPRPS